MRFRLAAGFVGFVLLGAVSVEAQERDTFEYWDTSGNGDLTCTEAYRTGGPAGLKLPAYRDDRDGTGLIPGRHRPMLSGYRRPAGRSIDLTFKPGLECISCQ